jgi:transcriptional regulator with XRE-family HTH domain
MDSEDLKRRRKALGLTQEQLAQALGVTRQSVYLWETGTRLPAGRLLDLAMRGLEQEIRERDSNSD